TLTSELATKTTVSGLISGRVVVATSANTIGTSSITNAQLTGLVSPTITINDVSGVGSNSGASGSTLVFTLTKTGPFIATLWATSESQGVGSNMMSKLYLMASGGGIITYAQGFGGGFNQGANVTATLTLIGNRSEEHTSELQSRENLVC